MYKKFLYYNSLSLLLSLYDFPLFHLEPGFPVLADLTQEDLTGFYVHKVLFTIILFLFYSLFMTSLSFTWSPDSGYSKVDPERHDELGQVCMYIKFFLPMSLFLFYRFWQS